jgi:hypothetical protein
VDEIIIIVNEIIIIIIQMDEIIIIIIHVDEIIIIIIIPQPFKLGRQTA